MIRKVLLIFLLFLLILIIIGYKYFNSLGSIMVVYQVHPDGTQTLVESKTELAPSTLIRSPSADYIIFNEDSQKKTHKYRVGDTIILGDECASRVKGVIKFIGKNGFNVEINENEGKDPENHSFVKQSPKDMDIISGTFIPSVDLRKCTDIEVKGTGFFIDNFIDENNVSYLNILQTLKSDSLMGW